MCSFTVGGLSSPAPGSRSPFEFGRNPWVKPLRRGARAQARASIADYAASSQPVPGRALSCIAVFFEAQSFSSALHLRRRRSARAVRSELFSAVGLVVAGFGVGGLIYAATVRVLVDAARPERARDRRRLVRDARLSRCSPCEPFWESAPLAARRARLRLYMLHNTLQTNATQMAPEARGTASRVFSSALFLGQSAGVAARRADRRSLRRGTVSSSIAAVLWPLLRWWIVRRSWRTRRRIIETIKAGRARRARSRRARSARPGPAGCRRARS